MKLSNDLISQFVKTTSDNDKTKSETTVYGTVVKQDSTIYVKLDGSELLTPASSTTVVKNGERVTVMIKNHTAVITGNISSPSAQDDDVKVIGSKISEFEIVIADKVSTVEFEAEKARINEVVADNVLIKDKLTANDATIGKLNADYLVVNSKLTAAEADIGNLKAKKLDVEIADITYATIANLEATNIKVNNLESTYGEFKDLVTEKFTASEAEILDLKAKKLDVESADLLYAKIGDFTAISGKVEIMETGLQKVTTLLGGDIIAGSTDTIVLNARNTTIENALIKSAMIESLAFDKITGIEVNTSKLIIHSDDGKSKWQDNTIQISDATRIRVQIGKDASGDYNLYVWDAAGRLMFDAKGVTDNGIQRPIIVDGMISDNANIAGEKINITSLVKEINDGTETIKSSHILIDGTNQSLSVAYNTIVGDISKLSTNLSIEQGKISSLITDVNTAKGDVTTLKTNYSSLTQTVNGLNSTVGEHTTSLTGITTKQTELEQTVNGFDSRITSAINTAEGALIKVNEVNATVDGFDIRISSAENNASTALSKTNTLEQKVTASALITTISSGISGGTALTTTKFIMDAAGLHIKNGGFDISNNAGTKVLSADTAGNLSITASINAASGKIGKFVLNDGLTYTGSSTYQGMGGSVTENYSFIISPNSAHKNLGDIARDFVSNWTSPLLKVNTSNENSFELYPDGFLRSRQIKMGDGVVEGTLYFGSSQYSNNVYINSGGNINCTGSISCGNLSAANTLCGSNWWTSGNGWNLNNDMNTMHFAYSNHNAPTNGMTVTFGGAHQSYPLQISSQYNGYRLYYRNRNDDGPGWLGWTALANTSDAMTPVSHNHSYATWFASQYSTTGWMGFYNAYGGTRKAWMGHDGGTDFYIQNEAGGVIRANKNIWSPGFRLDNSAGASFACYWVDGATHDIVSIGSDRKNNYHGPGDGIGETVTNLRGKYVKLYNHSGGYCRVNGSAITSDRNLKTDFRSFSKRHEVFFMNLKPQVFKYETGTAKRDHFGFVAQDVEQALKCSSLSTNDFAGVIIDKSISRSEDDMDVNTLIDKGLNEMHLLRMEEFIALNTHMIQKTIKRVDKHEEELAKLKQENAILKSKLDSFINGELEVKTCQA